jgi:hypothetical protein
MVSSKRNPRILFGFVMMMNRPPSQRSLYIALAIVAFTALCFDVFFNSAWVPSPTLNDDHTPTYDEKSDPSSSDQGIDNLLPLLASDGINEATHRGSTASNSGTPSGYNPFTMSTLHSSTASSFSFDRGDSGLSGIRGVDDDSMRHSGESSAEAAFADHTSTLEEYGASLPAGLGTGLNSKKGSSSSLSEADLERYSNCSKVHVPFSLCLHFNDCENIKDIFDNLWAIGFRRSGMQTVSWV